MVALNDSLVEIQAEYRDAQVYNSLSHIEVRLALVEPIIHL